VDAGTFTTYAFKFKTFQTHKHASLKCFIPKNMCHEILTTKIVATIHKAPQQNMSRKGESRTITPSNGTYPRERRGRSDDYSDSDDSSEGRDWKRYAYDLEKEIKRLREMVESLRGDAEAHKRDLVERSLRRVECDPEMYKRIGEYTKQTLFRHIKFITSDTMLNDLESKTSLGNITMNHYRIDERDRIAWWRSCNVAVSDAISNHRNQVTQAIKAQVLSKYIKEMEIQKQNS
jgi:hypothetical protein